MQSNYSCPTVPGGFKCVWADFSQDGLIGTVCSHESIYPLSPVVSCTSVPLDEAGNPVVTGEAGGNYMGLLIMLAFLWVSWEALRA